MAETTSSFWGSKWWDWLRRYQKLLGNIFNAERRGHSWHSAPFFLVHYLTLSL